MLTFFKRTSDLVREFGIKVTAAKILQSCTCKIPKICELTGKIKYNAITGFLYKENKEILDEYNEKKHSTESKIEDGNVWVLWWQGLDNAPDIVKVCINSIKDNIGDRRLVVLDESNYQNYTNLDSFYKHLLEAELISKTQFSDLLRLNLLYNQGGIWLDSTYLMTGAFPEYAGSLHFYTIRHGMNKEYPMSKGLWTSSAIGSAVCSDAIKLFIDVYDNYFKRHHKLIDYLLTDYVFAVCCDNCHQIREMFRGVPYNNQNVNELLKVMNKPYSAALVENTTGRTVLNKLNRRFPLKIELNGKETIYGHFRKQYFCEQCER